MPRTPEWNPKPLAETARPSVDKIRDEITTIAGSAIREGRDDVVDQLRQIGRELAALEEMI
jgi:hypothetical protein